MAPKRCSGALTCNCVLLILFTAIFALEVLIVVIFDVFFFVFLAYISITSRYKVSILYHQMGASLRR